MSANMARLFLAFVFGLWLFSSGALADYFAAQTAFAKLSDETKAHIAVSLIATGDFNGLYSGCYTERLHSAMRHFRAAKDMRRPAY
jgi:site-specific recombinase